MSPAYRHHRLRIMPLLILVGISGLPGDAVRAQGKNSAASEFAAVKHIFEHRCLSCHNDIDRKGDFSLQSQEALRESGYLSPGDAANSHLLAVVLTSAGEAPAMPQGSDPLSGEETDTLQNWIANGAHWPAGVTLAEPAVDSFDWWSFQQIQPPVVPDKGSVTGAWSESPIDLFIAAKHRELGLQHSARADRRTLIRRVTYDLTGLPPTPEEVTAFVQDENPKAYEELVERLLSSTAYGERWARHWLDVVKYADTCGYDKDKLRPNAYPYRDYVIRSFNEDKSYARFVQEQIAGDVLFPGQKDGILGLGFLAAGPWDFNRIDARLAGVA